MESKYELLNCPFCGKNAKFDVKSHFKGNSEVGFDFEVSCTGCGAKMPRRYSVNIKMDEAGNVQSTMDEREKAAAAWNHRVCTCKENVYPKVTE